MSVPTPEEKKILWRCRRGTKELDILLCHYFEHHYQSADAGHRRAFECLLELPDPDIYDLLTGATVADDAMTDDIVRSIAATLDISGVSDSGQQPAGSK